MQEKIKIPFCFTSQEAKALYENQPPQYATEGASGFDLRAVEFCCYTGCYGGYEVAATHDDIVGIKYNNVLCLSGGSRVLVKTGIRIALDGRLERYMPKAFTEPLCIKPLCLTPQLIELQIRSRSGLALKHGIQVLNAPATIDNDFTGEIGVILHNSSRGNVALESGMRIAQGVLNPLSQAIFEENSIDLFEELYCKTERGSNGFGSTGIK